SNTKVQAAYMHHLGAIPLIVIALHLGGSKLEEHRVIARRAHDLAKAAHETAALSFKLPLPPLTERNEGDFGFSDEMNFDLDNNGHDIEESEADIIRQILNGEEEFELSIEDAIRQLPEIP